MSRRVLVLGANGMLGNAVVRTFSDDPTFEVFGSVRRAPSVGGIGAVLGERLVDGIDVLDQDALLRLLSTVKPDLVVNCVGLVKQLSTANDPLAALPINAILPHRLARACSLAGARVIHVSTDCVFSGRSGNYAETDFSDAADLYGRSKYLGELADYPNAITLRTSIIGHELGAPHGLVDWFLSQAGSVRGFRRAIFSGLPTVALASIMRDLVAPRPELTGVYHVAAAPISKLDLLRIVAATYGHDVDIEPDDSVVIDRSLDASRFRAATGYVAPAWPELITLMKRTR